MILKDFLLFSSMITTYLHIDILIVLQVHFTLNLTCTICVRSPCSDVTQRTDLVVNCVYLALTTVYDPVSDALSCVYSENTVWTSSDVQKPLSLSGNSFSFPATLSVSLWKDPILYISLDFSPGWESFLKSFVFVLCRHHYSCCCRSWLWPSDCIHLSTNKT